MTYTLAWRENALNSLAGYLDDDPTGVGEVFNALDQLTANPYPPYASKIGPAFACGSAATASCTRSTVTP